MSPIGSVVEALAGAVLSSRNFYDKTPAFRNDGQGSALGCRKKSGSEGDLFFLLAQDFAREWIHVVNLLAYDAGNWLVSVVV